MGTCSSQWNRLKRVRNAEAGVDPLCLGLFIGYQFIQFVRRGNSNSEKAAFSHRWHSHTASILVSPMQNGFIERINRGYREAILDMLVFQSLKEVCE